MTTEHEGTIKQSLLFRGGLEFVLVGFGHRLLLHAVLFHLTGVTSATRRTIVVLLGHLGVIAISEPRESQPILGRIIRRAGYAVTFLRAGASYNASPPISLQKDTAMYYCGRGALAQQ